MGMFFRNPKISRPVFRAAERLYYFSWQAGCDSIEKA